MKSGRGRGADITACEHSVLIQKTAFFEICLLPGEFYRDGYILANCIAF